MLTVLNRMWDGTEDIVEAVRVTTARVLNPDAQTSDQQWQFTVFAQLKDNDPVNSASFAFGKVFVMNSNGKTVAVYDLPAPPVGPSLGETGEIKA